MRAALLNFSKGEISPEMEARFDMAAYQVGLRLASNVKIRRMGGVSKRMGTRFVTECLSSTAKLFPFQFSDEQGYALEFGQAYMRPLALGGAVLENGLKITAITKAAQAKISAAHHGYTVGQQVFLLSEDPAAFGMYQILGRWLTVVSVQSTGQFTVDINSTNFSTFGTDVGVVNASPPPPPPPPPSVPAPVAPPPAPPVGSGGGGGYVPNPTPDPLPDGQDPGWVWYPKQPETGVIM